MKPLIFALWVGFAFAGLNAQTPGWQPSQGHTQVPIWPGAAPDPQSVAGPEVIGTDTKELAAGRPWVEVGKVSRPTMTVYSPRERTRELRWWYFPAEAIRFSPSTWKARRSVIG